MAEAVQIGRFSPNEATAIRRAGKPVIPRIESCQPPFDGGLIDWRPDPAWPLPSLPDDRTAG